MAPRKLPPEYDFQRMSQNLPFMRNSKEAREWFRDLAMNVNKMSVPKFQGAAKPFQNFERLKISSDPAKQEKPTIADNLAIGKMYFFTYDPKHKLTLPYYDNYPLVFPIGFKAGAEGNPGFLGLNMHYLPPGLRARFMDNLYSVINNDKWDNTTKLNVTYQALKSYSALKYFKPCIHHYLMDHVKSPYLYIRPEQWDYTLLLPLARFQKKSQDFVWLESTLKV